MEPPGRPALTGGACHALRPVLAARNAGVAAWAVPYGYNAGRPITEAHPERIFQTLGEVARYVLAGRASHDAVFNRMER